MMILCLRNISLQKGFYTFAITVTFDQYKASFLDKSVYFFQKDKK